MVNRHAGFCRKQTSRRGALGSPYKLKRIVVTTIALVLLDRLIGCNVRASVRTRHLLTAVNCSENERTEHAGSDRAR